MCKENMNKKILVFLVCIAFIVNACGPNANLTRRYYEQQYEPQNKELLPDQLVDFSAFVLATQRNTSNYKTVFDLGEKAQAEFIRAVSEQIKENKNSKDPVKDLISALATPIQRPRRASNVLYSNTFDRQIVFSFENSSLNVADRIRWLKVKLSLKDEKLAEFKSWNKFTSEYNDVDLGRLIFTQGSNTSLEIGASVPVGSAGLSPSASAEFERTLTEEVQLRQRYEEFSGRLEKHSATFVREGVVGIDLTGEAIVGMTIEVEYTPVWYTSFRNLFVHNNPNDHGKVKISNLQVFVPKEARPICAEAELEYILRHVHSGENSVVEGDDHVTDYYGKLDPLTLELIPKEDLAHYAWKVMILDGETRRSLHLDWRVVEQDKPKPRVIWFNNYDKAEDFVVWLKKTNSNRVAGKQICKNIGVACKTIDSEDIKNLEIEFQPINSVKDSNECSAI